MIELRRATNGIHKWQAVFSNGGPTVRFGRKGYSDYTRHKDRARMQRYLVRHARRENWTRSGRHTAGFWSRWILWSHPTLQGAIRKTARVLQNKIVLKK